MLLLIDNPAEGIFHVSALGKVFEIKRGRVFDDFSFVHHNHAGGERLDLLHNMSGNHNEIGFAVIFQKLSKFVLLIRIEPFGGFVKNQNLRFV